MTFLHLDFHAPGQLYGGTAVRQFHHAGIRLATGAWDSVEIDNKVQFVFPKGSIKADINIDHNDLAALSSLAVHVEREAWALAASMMTATHMSMVVTAIRNAHIEGVLRGREDKVHEIREVLGL